MRQGGDRKGCVEGDPSGYREGQDSEVKGRGAWRGESHRAAEKDPFWLRLLLSGRT